MFTLYNVFLIFRKRGLSLLAGISLETYSIRTALEQNVTFIYYIQNVIEAKYSHSGSKAQNVSHSYWIFYSELITIYLNLQLKIRNRNQIYSLITVSKRRKLLLNCKCNINIFYIFKINTCLFNGSLLLWKTTKFICIFLSNSNACS